MKIAVASGKGGTGKTLIATNLFWTIQNNGIPVNLVDCDAEEPNVAEFISGDVLFCYPVIQNIPSINPAVCVFCGKCFQYCDYHAIVYVPAHKFIQVVEDLCHDCGACTVACRFGAITQKDKQLGKVRSMHLNNNAELLEARAEVGVYSAVSVIKEAIQKVDLKYLTILDSPPGISCPFIATVKDADFVILVTEPTPFGLNDLKLSVEVLQQLGKPLGVIINRTGFGNQAVQEWLNQNNIPLLLEIPFDREIAKIYSEGHLLAEEKLEYRFQFMELLRNIEILTDGE